MTPSVPHCKGVTDIHQQIRKINFINQMQTMPLTTVKFKNGQIFNLFQSIHAQLTLPGAEDFCCE